MSAKGQVGTVDELEGPKFRKGQQVRIAKGAGVFTITGFGVWNEDTIYADLISDISPRVHRVSVARLVHAW